MRYADQDGNEITQQEWQRLFEDMAYRRVGSTTVHNRWWVSTVWLGLNHAAIGLPLYFETMVFDLDNEPEAETAARYPTRVMAKRGHSRIVNQIREGKYKPFE